MKHTIIALALATGALAVGGPALAHTTIGDWASNKVVMSAAQVSFPAGSSYRTALGKIEDSFYYEQPSEMWFEMKYDDPSIGFDNGQSEVWFSSSSTYSPAVTFWWKAFDFASFTSKLVEADIVFYNGISYTTSTSKTAIWSYGGSMRPFETTAMHEFGHAAGLGHENDEYNIMGTDWTHIACNGSTVRSYVGEDASNGLVSLYGPYSGGTIDDLSVTLFKYLGESGEYSTHDACKMFTTAGVELPSSTYDGQKRYNVSKGQTVRVQFTFENNGENYKSNIQLGYYVSTNNFISSSDTMFATSAISMGRDDVFTRWDTVVIPSNLTSGSTYFLGVQVDRTGAIAEATESNNAAYHAIRIN
jgi:hypothetical protein